VWLLAALVRGGAVSASGRKVGSSETRAMPTLSNDACRLINRPTLVSIFGETGSLCGRYYSARALGNANFRQSIDFSASAFRADERKPVRQVWLLFKRNLDPTVGASHRGIGLGGNH